MKTRTRLDYLSNGIWIVYEGKRKESPKPGNILHSAYNLTDLMNWCLHNGHADVHLSPMAELACELETQELRYNIN